MISPRQSRPLRGAPPRALGGFVRADCEKTDLQPREGNFPHNGQNGSLISNASIAAPSGLTAKLPPPGSLSQRCARQATSSTVPRATNDCTGHLGDATVPYARRFGHVGRPGTEPAPRRRAARIAARAKPLPARHRGRPGVDFAAISVGSRSGRPPRAWSRWQTLMARYLENRSLASTPIDRWLDRRRDGPWWAGDRQWPESGAPCGPLFSTRCARRFRRLATQRWRLVRCWSRPVGPHSQAAQPARRPAACRPDPPDPPVRPHRQAAQPSTRRCGRVAWGTGRFLVRQAVRPRHVPRHPRTSPTRAPRRDFFAFLCVHPAVGR